MGLKMFWWNADLWTCPSNCKRQLFSSVNIVKYGYVNSISTLFLSFFECMWQTVVFICLHDEVWVRKLDINTFFEFFWVYVHFDGRYRPSTDFIFVWTDRYGRHRPISGYYETNRPSISTVILRKCNRTDRRYRPCFPVGGTEPTVDIDRDQPTGRLKPTDRTDDTCGSFASFSVR